MAVRNTDQRESPGWSTTTTLWGHWGSGPVQNTISAVTRTTLASSELGHCGIAVNNIRVWWVMMSIRYTRKQMLVVIANYGDNNSCCSRLWKCELQRFADKMCLTVAVRHIPLETSKWNKIEHRLFSFISMNWCYKPLTSYKIIVNFIWNTTNSYELRADANSIRESTPKESRS